MILAYDRILVTTGYIGDEGQENGRNSEVIVRYLLRVVDRGILSH